MYIPTRFIEIMDLVVAYQQHILLVVALTAHGVLRD